MFDVQPRAAAVAVRERVPIRTAPAAGRTSNILEVIRSEASAGLGVSEGKPVAKAEPPSGNSYDCCEKKDGGCKQ